VDILILGTGALATLFAARLSASSQRVTLLGAWPAALEALSSSGARLVDQRGGEHAYAVRATADTRECRGASHALVLVKAWQTARAARQLAECLAPDGLAVTLQNGLGNYETLVGQLGAGRVSLGATTTGATLLGPGLVRAGGEGVVSIEAHSALGPLETALRSAGFNVQVVDQAGPVVWGKLAINAAINPLSALLRVSNGQLLESPAALELMAGLARETARLAGVVGVELPYPDPAAAAADVARRTAANRSSMLQDVLRGAPTEIDAICGAIARLGEQHGVGVPLNRACWLLVRALGEAHK
jgi:2-dehydropantoate 2-reductase